MPISTTVEDLRPRIDPNTEQFTLPDGATGLFSPTGRYLRVPAEQAFLLSAMDGTRHLRQLAVHGALEGRLLAIRTLLGLVGKLARDGFLANAPKELSEAGFAVGAKHRGVTHFLAQLLFAFTLTSRRLGKGAGLLVRLFRPLPSATTIWVIASLIGAGGLAAIVYGLGLPLPCSPLLLHGSYASGLLAAYCGALLALSGRQLARAWVLGATRTEVYAAGIEMRVFVPAPHLDGRHAFRQGPAGERRLAWAGIAGTCVSAAAFAGLSVLASVHGGPSLALGLFAVGATLALLGATCPFARTDAGVLMDLTSPDGRGRDHALSYLQRRLLSRQGKNELFVGEHRHIFTVASAVAWVYLAFYASAETVDALLLPAALLPASDLDLGDAVAVGIALGGAALILVLMVLLFLGGLVRLVLGALPKRAGKPSKVASSQEQVRETLAGTALFAHLSPDTRASLANAARLVVFRRGLDVVREGEAGHTFFVVREGEVEVLVTQDSGVEQTVATLGPGDAFGESALVDATPRNATVRTLARTTLVTLDREDFLAALRAGEVPPERVTAMIRCTSAIRRSEIFRDMTPSALAKVVGHCERERHEAGEVLMREGEPGERFFVIEAGSVVVERREATDPVAKLGPGDFFGEVALLCNIPRTATVTCSEDSVLLALDRERFRDVLAQDFSAAMRLEQVAEQRTGGRA